MSFPYLFESNFERGEITEWDSETDVENYLTPRHYSFLAKMDQTSVGPIAPYRGAYVLEANMQGVAATHQLIEADIAIADQVTRYSAFNLFVGNDVVATVVDNFNIYELRSASTQGAVALQVQTDGRLFISTGQTGFTEATKYRIAHGRWYHVELESFISTGVDGTETLFVDGVQVQQVTGLTNSAVTSGRIGERLALATTTGHIFFNDLIFDDTRIYPYKERYPDNVWITKSQHVFVGPGWIDEAAVTSASGSLTLYDTDTADINNAEAVVDLNTSQGRIFFDGGAEFKRGCYAVLSTGHEAEVRIHTGAEFPGQYGPGAHWSAGAVRRYGQLRKVHRQGT